MKTQGHLANNGGVRGHSAGDIFPWMVIGRGVPGVSFRWYIINPAGEKVSQGYSTAAAAYSLASHLGRRTMYLVKLGIYIGEYDKIAIHLVKADNPRRAHENALADESHNDDAGYDDDGIWQDGDASYDVMSVRKLTADEAQVLRGVL